MRCCPLNYGLTTYLVFRNMVLMWRLNDFKLRKIKVFSKYNYLKVNKLRQYFSNFVMY